MDSGSGCRCSGKDYGSDRRYSRGASCFDYRNVGLIVEMRADFVEEILRFSVGFSSIFRLFFNSIFSAVFQWGLQVAEVGTQSKMKLCVKCRDLVKIFIFRSGVIFTPEVGMIVIALVLALVEKPTTTWTQLNMLLMLMNVTSNPKRKGIGNKSIAKVGEQNFAISCRGPTKLVMSRV